METNRFLQASPYSLRLPFRRRSKCPRQISYRRPRRRTCSHSPPFRRSACHARWSSAPWATSIRIGTAMLCTAHMIEVLLERQSMPSSVSVPFWQLSPKRLPVSLRALRNIRARRKQVPLRRTCLRERSHSACTHQPYPELGIEQPKMGQYSLIWNNYWRRELKKTQA